MARETTILDGGMSRELERLGAPFRQPEWSALALMETPEIVEQVHTEFLAAGAQVIITNNYAVVPFHLGEERFAREGRRLIELSGELARSAASRFPGARVAGCIPPLFGSYRPDLFDAERAGALLDVIVRGLAPYVDVWLSETTSSIAEMRAVAEAVAQEEKPLWVSYTLEDEIFQTDASVLRSGEPVRDAVIAAVQEGAQAVLFNCSTPEVMGAGIQIAVETVPEGIPVGVYANAFAKSTDHSKANEGIAEIRDDLDPEGYALWAKSWRDLGASIIGGCCGIGAAHIAALAEAERKVA